MEVEEQISQECVGLKERLVHLDLKGAPPNVCYFKKIFPLFKKWGATGVIIEYEDSFPYSGKLKNLSASHSYSNDDVKEILDAAAGNDLFVMPLVQTFGHLEFVLKHEEFSSLREMDRYPMAICPCHTDSMPLLQSMLDQVFSLHPRIQYFHIGCDEVYHLGLCSKCTSFMASRSLQKEQLFFYHVKNVASYIKENYPHITCIIWDDMFRSAELSLIVGCGLGKLVEPMVWQYMPNFVLPDDLWDRLSATFPTLWVASAFKGATGPRANITNISYHLDNHMAWLAVLRSMSHKFKTIKGIAITGWQRYDHYATLCELLPQALPSIALCLKLVMQETLNESDVVSTSEELGFTSPLSLNPLTSQVLPTCSFPGSEVYTLIIEFVHMEQVCREFFTSEYMTTWMNDFNVARGFVNPVHIEPLLAKAMELLRTLKAVDLKGESSFRHVFSSRLVFEEWRAVNVSPLELKLEDIINKSRSLIIAKSNLRVVGSTVRKT